MGSRITQRKIVNKIEILVKTGELSTIKLVFDKSHVEIENNFLFVYIEEEGSKTTKIFNINDISAFKEYYNITNK